MITSLLQTLSLCHLNYTNLFLFQKEEKVSGNQNKASLFQSTFPLRSPVLINSLVCKGSCCAGLHRPGNSHRLHACYSHLVTTWMTTTWFHACMLTILLCYIHAHMEEDEKRAMVLNTKTHVLTEMKKSVLLMSEIASYTSVVLKLAKGWKVYSYFLFVIVTYREWNLAEDSTP